MKELFIHNLILENYRNFQRYELNVLLSPVIIIGENGSGKTNILEAISLIFPGRGLRNSKFDEICKYGQKGWSAHYKLQSKLGVAQLENLYNLQINKRQVLFNGSKIGGNELSKVTNIIWLTPQMDGLFLDTPKIRQKFFDRIVYSFDEKHANQIAKYEFYLKERNKILLDHFNDISWLEITEQNLATIALEVANTRFKILQELQQVMTKSNNPFPKAELLLVGELESDIQNKKEEEILELIINKFKSCRATDRLSGRTSYGAHRTDFTVSHAEKRISGKYCSTGEQKALLIAIILAQITLIIKQTSINPIILFDEIFVHLDDIRKNYLIQFFKEINAQIWITATDTRGIEELVGHAQLIKI